MVTAGHNGGRGGDPLGKGLAETGVFVMVVMVVAVNTVVGGLAEEALG